MKVKYLILIQCLLITFVLYMFKDLFIITLPAWLITLPVTVPLLVYIIIRYFKKRKSIKLKSEDNKIEMEVSQETYDYLLSCIVLELNGKQYIERDKVQSMLVKFVKEQTNELVHALTIAQKRLEQLINATPTGELKNTLIDENLIIHELIYRLTAESEIFGETVYLEQCAWNKNPKVKKVDICYEISTEKEYGNSRRNEKPDNIEEAIKLAITKRNKGDEYDTYHNSQNEVITKVTTIREIVKLIKAEEKI